MLGWVSLRSKALVSHIGRGSLANVAPSPTPSPASVSSCVRHLSRSILSSNLVTSNSCRFYVKRVHVSRKSVIGKKKAPGAPPVYDEDFEDISNVNSDDYDIEDSYEEVKNDPSFLKSSSQIEQILRETLPPEMVEKAIAEHRRVYSAYKSGTLSSEDAQRAGFTKRIDPAKLNSSPSVGSASASASSPMPVSSTTRPIASNSSRKSTSASTSMAKKTVSSKKSKSSSKAAPKTSSPRVSRTSPIHDDGDDDFDPDMDEYGDGEEQEAIPRRGASDALSDVYREREDFEKDLQTYRLQKSGDIIEYRKQRLEELMKKQEELENEPDEDYLHRRMERLRSILISKLEEAGEDDMVLTEEEAAMFERRASKPFTLQSEPTSVLALRARDCVAQGRWNDAFEIYHHLARNDNTAQILSTFAGEALANKQYEVAGKAAVEAFNINEHDVRANRMAAKVYIETFDEAAPDAERRLSMAHHHIDRALEQHPEWPDLLAVKATIYMKAKQYKVACAYFKAALIESDRMHLERSSRLPIFRDYGKCLAGRGKYKLALSYFNIAHQLAPEDLEIISLLGELHERGFNDIKAAAPFYQLAVKINPEDVPSLVRLAQLLADPAYEEQNLSQARQCYERAMMLQPLPEFWFPLGWISMSLGQNDKAIMCLQKAAEMDPEVQNRWTSIVLLAEIYSFDEDPKTQSNSLKKAIQLYKFALEEKPDSEIKLNLAKCYLRAGKVEDAEALLQIIKMENPDNCDMKCVLVEAYQAAGRMQDALRELDEILRDHPEEAMPRFMKGSYLFEIGDYRSAIPFLEKAVATASANPESMMNTPQFAEALSQLESQLQGSVPKEFAALKRKKSQAFVESDDGTGSASTSTSSRSAGVRSSSRRSASILNDQAPDQTDFLPEAHRLLSRCYVELEDWPSAKKTIAFALAYEPENTNLLVALGEAQLKLGEEDDAVDTFRRASVVDRSAFMPNFQLGNLFVSRGQQDQAVAYYQKALDVWNKIAGAREAGTEYQTSESISEEELVSAIYNIYLSLGTCYSELATQDRSNHGKYTKLAKQCIQRAHEIKQTVEQ